MELTNISGFIVSNRRGLFGAKDTETDTEAIASPKQRIQQYRDKLQVNVDQTMGPTESRARGVAALTKEGDGRTSRRGRASESASISQRAPASVYLHL